MTSPPPEPNNHTPPLAETRFSGRLGTVLFYLCLVAIVASPLVAAISYSNERDDQSKIKAQQAHIAADERRLRAEQKRQCAAIAGATDFWKGVRETTRLALQDHTLSPTARLADRRYIEALDEVISHGEKLACVRKAE